MIIKKFTGKTEAEALEQAKAELGEGLVVMNVKNVKKNGILGFLQKQMTEVTVALEEENVRTAALAKSQADSEKALKEAVSAVAQVAVKTAENTGRSTAGPEPDEAKLQPKRDFISETMNYIEKKENNAIQEKLDSLQNLLEQKLTNGEEEKQEEKEEADEITVFLNLLRETMLDNEIREDYVSQILEETEKIKKPNMPLDHILAHTYQKMILKFGNPEEITPATKGPKIVFFVGPTGVGKTTTIAKIASKFAVEDKKKTALLTADTFRIAAAEQLRTYASILQIPFRIIYVPDELKEVYNEFIDYDYIFVDTAGHSYQNETQRENVKAFVHTLDEAAETECYLVVSATTKYKDLMNIADSYKEVADYKLIFTKLDETSTCGNLLNLKLYTGASMSYVTCGQNVPEDIENFNPQKTVKKLLGGKK